jgi:hypothetical protein
MLPKRKPTHDCPHFRIEEEGDPARVNVIPARINQQQKDVYQQERFTGSP